jgi:hypothetical protein
MVQDVSGDKVADVVFRTDTSGRLQLRKGIAASGGGVNLTSLGSGAASAGGTDGYWSGTGWTVAEVPHILGTPDANGDGIPDLWAVRSNGSVRFYAGDRVSLPGSGVEVIAPTAWWKSRLALG